MNAKRVLLGAAAVAAIAMVYRTLKNDDAAGPDSTNDGVDRIDTDADAARSADTESTTADADDSPSGPASAATQG